MKLDPKKKYQVKDEKGEWHNIRRGYGGEYRRDAYSGARIAVSIGVYLVFINYVQGTGLNTAWVVTVALIAIFVIKFFALQVVLNDEELKNVREVPTKDK